MKFKSSEILAKAVVAATVRQQPVPTIEMAQVPKNLQVPGACFVTLYVGGKLHGCIGTLEARQPLFRDISENALGAATRDWRFPPLTEADLADLTVEISVLTPLEVYRPKSPEDLLMYLTAEKPGLVLEKRGLRAVFLPQVWQQLPLAEEFLGRLCLKAGLNYDDWREGASFKIFKVQTGENSESVETTFPE